MGEGWTLPTPGAWTRLTSTLILNEDIYEQQSCLAIEEKIYHSS